MAKHLLRPFLCDQFTTNASGDFVLPEDLERESVIIGTPDNIDFYVMFGKNAANGTGLRFANTKGGLVTQFSSLAKFDYETYGDAVKTAIHINTSGAAHKIVIIQTRCICTLGK